jgi:PAS domain S-box-containing protein
MPELALNKTASAPQRAMAPEGFPFHLFFLLFIPAALLILASAWYVGHDRVEDEMDVTRADEANSVVLSTRRLDRWLEVPLRHLRALAHDEALSRAIDNPSPDNAAQLEAAFQKLVTYYPAYDQVRWIDERGKERVRVNSVGGHPESVPGPRLQNKADRSYFIQTMQLKAGQPFLSPLDLNVEAGQIEIPFKPVLRLATPVTDRNGNRRGILIINVAATPLLDAFTESTGGNLDHVALLNADGYWLRSVHSADEWGFMFNRTETLGTRSPAAWKLVSSRPTDQMELDDGLWTWSTVYPIKLEDNRDVANIPHWLIVSHLPTEALSLVRNKVWTEVSTMTAIALAGFAFLTAWLARAETSRNRARAEVAKAYAEAESAQRLSQAQERYRLLVKANVNGLLAVDADGLIVLANAALERMFGYETDELLGQSVEILLPAGMLRTHAEVRTAYMREPRARPMGAGRELHGRRKDGAVIAVEVSLSPFCDNGKQYVGAVVAAVSVGARATALAAQSGTV